MIALLRKDAPWLLVMLLAGSTALSIAWIATGFIDVWMFRLHRTDGPFHVAWAAGLVLGAVAARYDDLLGTREFLLQRPVGSARLHGARLLGCVLVLSCWMVVPPLVHWGIGALTGLAPFGRPEQIVDVWACTSIAWSACAVALFAASLPCGPWLRLCIAAAALLTVLMAIEGITVTDSQVHGVAAFTAAHLGAAVLFGAASFSCANLPADQDRPWPRPAGWLAPTGAVLIVTIAANAGLAALQRVSLWCYDLAQPVVANVGGQYRLCALEDRHSELLLHPVDAEQRVVGAPVELGKGARLVWSMYGSVSYAMSIDSPRFHRRRPWSPQNENWTSRAEMDEDGLFRRLQFDIATRHQRFVVAGKGPDDRPFRPAAKSLGALGSPDCEWIAEEGELWRLRPHDTAFARVPLPAGDVVVEERRVHAEEPSSLAPDDPKGRLVSVLVGKQGVYRIDADEPVVAPDWMRAEAMLTGPLVSEQVTEQQERLDITDSDLLHANVRVFDRNGLLLLEHAFSPRTAAQIGSASALLLCSMQRSVLLQAAALLVPEHTFPRWLDPLLFGGQRPWLAAATLAFAALWAWLGARRLRRIGAPTVVRLFWTAATLLLGPAAFVTGCWIEGPRRYAASPDAGPGVPPRIVSSELKGAPCTEPSPARS